MRIGYVNGMLFNKLVKNKFNLVIAFAVIILLLYLVSRSQIQQDANATNLLTKEILKNDILAGTTENHYTELKDEKLHTNMLESIKSALSQKPIRKMDRDPLGVILHMPEKDSHMQNIISTSHHEVGNSKQKFFHRIVHIDLKGAPPKLSYLKSILPLLRSLGATGLLIEYEDMFPYWGDLQIISAHNAYKKEEVRDLYESAKEQGLEVIPLIQTFGHMEHILKLKEFAFLREVPNYPQVICPTNNQTIILIKNIIDQIMEVHPGLIWLHIGSDEVYNLAECTRCQKYILNNNIQKEDLFLRHSYRIVKYIKDSYDIQPIMWDDEFRKISYQSIKNSDIGTYVEIMVWQYSAGILANIGNDIWEKYGEAFNGIWVASAFKGASSPDSFLTDINERLINNKEWMDVLDLYKGNIPFKGIVLTGWQRYDHFAVLCELLPQSIPSLAISLSYILNRKADHSALSAVGESLGCDSFLNLDLKYIEFVNHCNFPGNKVFEMAQRLYMLKKDISLMLEGNHVRGWITNYNIHKSFSSPQLVEQGLQDLSMLLYEFKKLYTDAQNTLDSVYDKYTVQEWVKLNLDETAEKLSNLFQARKELLEQTYWPRRPLELLKDKEL